LFVCLLAAEGLPGIEGEVAEATAAGASAAADAASAAAAQYLAQLCRQELGDFRAQHRWDPQLVPLVETGVCLWVQGRLHYTASLAAPASMPAVVLNPRALLFADAWRRSLFPALLQCCAR
jgi:hypothetical protein